jgi:hypothetical protein
MATIRATPSDAALLGYIFHGEYMEVGSALLTDAGMRYVPEEEDQMRRQDARLYPLPELQDGMYIHTGREKEATSERVRHPNPMYTAAFRANLT